MTREEKERIKRPLMDATIKALKPEAKRYDILDGDGLHVVVEPSGRKVFRYFWNHKKSQFTIGEYIPSQFGISMARKRRDEVKALVKQGKDPKEHFAEQERQAQERKDAGILFSEVVRQYLEWKDQQGLKDGTMKNTRWRINRYILPELGPCIMQEMTRQKDIVPFFRRLNAKNVPTEAQKVRSDIEGIFKFALTYGWTEERAITYGLEMLFSAMPKTQHFAACTDPVLFGEILRRVDLYSIRATLRSVGLAARLMPLVFLRRELLASLRWEAQI